VQSFRYQPIGVGMPLRMLCQFNQSTLMPFWAFLFFCIGAVLSAKAYACYEDSIIKPTPFMGNHGEIFKLTDGSIWEVQYEYEYMYEFYPNVVACPESGFIVIGDKKISARQITGNFGVRGAEMIESTIEGDSEGYEFDKVFKLSNGQIWQQIDARYRYRYKYRPDVLVISRGGVWYLQLEGMSDFVRVQRLR
jgi:hypothetical protein